MCESFSPARNFSQIKNDEGWAGGPSQATSGISPHLYNYGEKWVGPESSHVAPAQPLYGVHVTLGSTHDDSFLTRLFRVSDQSHLSSYRWQIVGGRENLFYKTLAFSFAHADAARIADPIDYPPRPFSVWLIDSPLCLGSQMSFPFNASPRLFAAVVFSHVLPIGKLLELEENFASFCQLAIAHQ